MNTHSVKRSEIARKWYLVDADGAILGRLASEVASILRGKHKPTFTPHLDVGDHVIVINAEKVRLSGEKMRKKVHYSHSGYPGGLKDTTYEELMRKRPELAIEKAVKGMLPKNKLGRAMYKKLHVYSGSQHPHGSQGPEVLSLGSRSEKG